MKDPLPPRARGLVGPVSTRAATELPARTFYLRLRRRYRNHMGIGVSLILIAVGAILTWAVHASVSGVDINTIGVILMIVGAVGILLSLMFWSRWGGPALGRRGGDVR